MPMDILLYAGVTVLLLVALFRVLGTKHGAERERPNPFAASTPIDTPIDGTATAAEPELRAKIEPLLGSNGAGLPRAVDAALVQIAIADHAFDARRFVEQAKDAFLLVVDAFAKGERETLKDLLSPSVYVHFDAEITAREQADESLLTEIQAIRTAEIIDAKMAGTVANVSVRFKVSEIYAIRTPSGAVRVGNEIRPVELTDIWTFSRDTAGRDPRWFLSATRPDETAAPERAG